MSLLPFLAFLVALPAQPVAVQATPVADDNEFIVLLRLRYDLWAKFKATGKWPDDDKAANEALAAHGQYWVALRDQGRAILAGGMGGDYWDNSAIIIFQASSLADAERTVAADPAVRAYVFQAQVRPFDVRWTKLP